MDYDFYCEKCDKACSRGIGSTLSFGGDCPTCGGETRAWRASDAEPPPSPVALALGGLVLLAFLALAAWSRLNGGAG